jgi:osmotically-inducible protein OsmY
VYGQGIPSNQRGSSGRDDQRDRNRVPEQYARPRGWDDDRWSEYSNEEPRWGASGYRESRQQTEGNRGRQQDFGHGFESRHPRFGESRLASYGRENFALPDYQGTSYEGQELARLRAGYRPDDESRRYAFENRVGGGAFHGQGSYGSRHFGKGPKGYTRADDRIRDDVCERLTYDPDVDASEITVSVSQGEVTLAGEVEDRRSKRRAEDIIEGVPGVRDVHNQLRARKGFFGSIVAEVTGKESDENNVGKGPHTATTSASVRNGGSALR